MSNSLPRRHLPKLAHVFVVGSSNLKKEKGKRREEKEKERRKEGRKEERKEEKGIRGIHIYIGIYITGISRGKNLRIPHRHGRPGADTSPRLSTSPTQAQSFCIICGCLIHSWTLCKQLRGTGERPDGIFAVELLKYCWIGEIELPGMK